MNAATWVAIAMASMQLVLFVIAVILFAWKIPTKDDVNKKIDELRSEFREDIRELRSDIRELRGTFMSHRRNEGIGDT